MSVQKCVIEFSSFILIPMDSLAMKMVV